MTTHSPKIGELLVKSGLINEQQLSDALTHQQQFGGRLGKILSAIQSLNAQQLATALADQQDIPWIDLHTHPCDPHLSAYEELPYFLSLRCLPWRLIDGYMIIACDELTPRVEHWAKQFYHDKVRFVLATSRDIQHSISELFGSNIEEETRTRLLQRLPHYSAFNTLYPNQKLTLWALLALLVAALILAPYSTLLVIIPLLNIFYIGTIGFKLLLYRQQRPAPSSAEALEQLDEQTLPIYTILIPLYHESETIPRLLDAIRSLDYPKSRLDVKLVVEEEDTQTIRAIKQAKPEAFFELIHVPYSLPQTKPKACNYALTFARGDFVTIYDAEDRPEPTQLKKAILAFRESADDVVCLQARLNYYNWQENLLTRLFAIEYSNLFDFMLPGLQSLNMPIPLGGTSNHINLKCLREIGEWDPYNVTEDADLGIRMNLRGYRTHVLDSITMEEAPIHLKAWVVQRSRWIKGYMQTWLVHMRQPLNIYQRLNPASFWGFQFFIGGPCLVFLLSPLLWLITLSWWLQLLPAPLAPNWLLFLCHIVLMGGIGTHLWLAFCSVKHWEGTWSGMRNAIALYPFYWFLHSLASLRAIWQLLRRPHFWDKTSHGLSQLEKKPPSTLENH